MTSHRHSLPTKKYSNKNYENNYETDPHHGKLNSKIQLTTLSPQKNGSISWAALGEGSVGGWDFEMNIVITRPRRAGEAVTPSWKEWWKSSSSSSRARPSWMLVMMMMIMIGGEDDDGIDDMVAMMTYVLRGTQMSFTSYKPLFASACEGCWNRRFSLRRREGLTGDHPSRNREDWLLPICSR